MIAKAYGDANLLTKLIESTDNNIRSLGGALLDVAGDWANMRDAIADGRVPARFDITAQLVEAVRTIDQLRQTGQKASEFLAQGTMFDQRDPATTALIKSFFNENMTRALGRQGVYDTLKMYADDAVQQSDESLFGDLDQVQPNELVDRAREQTNAQRRQGEQGGLFDRGPDALSQGDKTQRTQEQSTPLREDRQRPYGGSQQRTSTRQEAVQEERANAETQTNRRLDDGRADNTEAGREQQEGVQQERKAGEQTNRRQKNQTFRGTKKGSLLERVSFTDRQSVYRNAFVELGYDPTEAELFSPDKQYQILRDGLKARYGLAFVAKTKLTNIREVIDQLLDAYRGMQFMAAVLNLPESQIGLNGHFGLLLRRNVEYLGAFYPGGTGAKSIEGFITQHPLISLPRRSNSFAHEWGHALDFYLIDKHMNGAKNFMTKLIRSGDKSISDAFPENVTEAFGLVMRSLFFDRGLEAAEIMELERKIEMSRSEKVKQEAREKIAKIESGASQSINTKSKYYRSAQQMPNASYWTQPTEMLARAFEAYISHRVEANAGTTEFLGKGVDAYQSDAVERLALTFPKDEDRFNIFRAFDVMFDELIKEGILNPNQEPAAKNPENIYVLDPSKYYQELANGVTGGIFKGILKREFDAIGRDLQRIRNNRERPKDPRSYLDRITDANKIWANTNRGVLLSLEGRYKRNKNQAAADAIWEITRTITTDPGSGRSTVAGGTYSDAVFIQTNRLQDRLTSIEKEFELGKFTKEELDDLKEALTAQGTEAMKLPEKIRKPAAALRVLYNDIYGYLKRAGVDIGYVEDQGYLTRILDEAKVIEGQDSFVKDAQVVYSILWDKETGDFLQDVTPGQLNAISDLLKEAGALKKAQANLSKYAPMLRQLKKLMKKSMTDPSEQNEEELQNFIDENQESLEAYRQAAGFIYSIESANNWRTRIISGNPNSWSHLSHTPKQTKKRKLPAEADKVLANWYLQDPVESITMYLHSSVRKAEFNRRFGGSDDVAQTKLYKMLDALAQAGVAAHDIDYIKAIVAQETGQAWSGSPRKALDWINKVHSLTTMAMLGRVTLTSLAEPIVVGMQTGSWWDGTAAFFTTLREIAPTQSVRERRALARALGVVSSGLSNEVLQNRFGGQYREGKQTTLMTARFYARVGLTGLTNAQRRASMLHGINYFVALSETINDETASQQDKDYAERELLDFGIQKEDIKEFTEWMMQWSERIPAPEDVMDRTGELTDFGLILATGINRLVDQTIQNPKPSDRPFAANTNVGRFSYGLLSFNMAFFRNIMIKSWKKMSREFEAQGKARGSLIAAKAVVFPAMAFYFGHFVITVAREATLNGDEWDKHRDDGTLLPWLLAKAGIRTGATGLADPIINAVTGIKYERDIANVPVGPQLSMFLTNLAKFVKLWTQNSDKSNNAEWNAMKALYETTIQLAFAYMVGVMPGGSIVGAGTGLGYATASSPQFKKDFVDFFIGEKDSKKKKNNSDKSKKSGQVDIYKGLYY